MRGHVFLRHERGHSLHHSSSSHRGRGRLNSETVHDFHGSADNLSLNGTLCHQDLDIALSQRAQAKVDKYREGYAAPGLRHAFLRAIVSTSGRFHGEVLRLLFTLADKQTPTTSWPLLRPSLLNLRFTAGVGVGISGACGPPLVWRALKPLP